MALPLYKVMPHQLMDALLNFLQTKGFGTRSTDLFEMTLPGSPAPAASMAVIPQAGPMIPGEAMSRVGIQILVRDSDIRSCAARAENVWKELVNGTPALVNSLGAVFHGRFTANHFPSTLRYVDPNGYQLDSLNFTFLGLTTVA
jgi:hypothetical protein